MGPDVKDLVGQFMRTRTIPLVWKGDGYTSSVGTGTLFKIADRHFIITARHIFDAYAPDKVAYQARRDNTTSLATIGLARLVKPTTEHHDVAVIELLEDATKNKLSAGWEFLTLDNVAPASDDGLIALMGYPEFTSRSELWMPPKGIVYSSNRIIDPPKEAKNVNPDVDLFFEYGRTAVADDKEIDAPELNGTSGGSVWEYVDLDGGFWAPEKVVKVVGVQSARLIGKYFRAVNWGVVASILGQMDPDLKAAVMQILVVT
jgi:Trypsin-like peptidase domain